MEGVFRDQLLWRGKRFQAGGFKMWLPLLVSILALQITGTVGRSGEKPRFLNEPEIREKLKFVSEDTPRDVVLVQVRAAEVDNLPIKYTINEFAYFKIDDISGNISMKTKWDYEKAAPVTVMDITATDSEKDSRTISLVIRLNNTNDNKPVFADTREKIVVNESAPVGQILWKPTVTDADQRINSLLTVSCVNGEVDPNDDTCNVFHVNWTLQSDRQWQGVITLMKPLDYETAQSYSMRLRAFDGNNTQEQEVQIEVLDINDSPPRFVHAESKTIMEGVPVGSYIGFVSAIDNDQTPGIARPIRYEFVGDPEALKYFAVSKIGGNITNTQVLDYDNPLTPKEFTLQFKARELLQSSPEQLGNDSRTTADASITVILKDVNDNCPVFDKTYYVMSVPENIVSGTNLNGQLQLTDRDVSDEFRKFTLSLVDVTGTFELAEVADQTAPTTIFIKAKDGDRIDYESSTKTYDLTIIAKDQGNPSCSAQAAIRLEVQDVNDETPVFVEKMYTSTVVENAAEGTVVTRIQATDRDSGDFGTDSIRYDFVDKTQKLFQIDPVSGVVTVSRCATPGKRPCIDYEWEKAYSMSVRASDRRGDPNGNSEIVELIINILNVNDNPPEFIGNYTRYIREGTTEVLGNLTVKALDKDGDRITYSLVDNRGDSRLWTINENSGEVTPRRAVYRRDTSNGMFAFDALASDGSQRTVAGIRIIVTDVNDNIPTFVRFQDTVTIRENHGGDRLVKTVSVTDDDSPTSGNGQVDVAIEGGSFGKFIVKTVRQQDNYFVAEIYTENDATFDYDLQSQYVLTMKARDKGTPANTGTGTLTVFIEDVNNKNPFFDPPTIAASVFENVPIFTSVITVNAKDNDAGSSLEMSFGSPIVARNPSGTIVRDPTKYQSLFTVSKDGLVRTNQLLDRDIVSTLEVPLIVRDVSANPVQTGTGSLFIRILEYNDQAPQFEQSLYDLEVKEERSTGDFVASLVAFDEDDQISSYQLISNPERLFSIDSQTGVLTVNGRLDYESRHNVTLIARATDSGRPELSNTSVIFVRIININDNAPIFNQTIYEINLEEHSKRTDALGAVHATDRDEEDFGVVRYKANDTHFTVDSISGEIFLKKDADLDREAFTTYTFEITAYDSPLNASVRLQTTTQVYVILGDINDNCPTFKQGNSFNGKIIETADVGDQVLEMFASDIDYKENRSIKFTIDKASAVPQNGSNLFSILSVQSITANIESGRIEVRSSLRGKAGTYRFTVIASDQNGQNLTGDMCSTYVNVTIQVQEAINDPPRWKLPPNRNFSIDVLESQYLGMLVYDCKAEDEDTGKEGIVDYYFSVNRIIQSTTPEFRINRVTGVISARIVYDREQVPSYVLTIVAKDQGNPSASSETVLIVNVLDVNDNDPEFPMRNGQTIPYAFSVPEGATPESLGVIGVVSATDRDSDHRNNKVFYRIVAGNDDGLFDLGRESGALKLSPRARSGLDRETKGVYNMDVLAFNDVNDDSVIRNRRRRSTNPSIVMVSVTVEDSNDTPPKFLRTDYHGCVPRDSPFHQSIVKVEAVDQDINRARFMTYTKIQESTNSYFMIEERLGIVRNAKLLNDIDASVSILRIRVSDNANQGSARDSSAETDVKVFVTDTSNEVKLVIGQPSADVRYYKDQIVRAMINTSSSTPVSYICIREIRDHLEDDGTFSYTSSDVFLSAVYMDGGSYKMYKGEQLSGMLGQELHKYRSLHVKSVEEVKSEEDELSLTEDSVLAIFLIAILLIFLALILFILACCLIRNSKKKKMKKLRAEGHTQPVLVHQPAPEVGTNVNPVYDNKGFDDGNEYAVVQKKRPSPEPVVPPIIPVAVMVPEDEVEPDPVLVIPVEEPEPVIITEPVMSEEEEPPMQPPPEDFFSSEPEPESPPPEPEPVIETEVVSDDDLYHIPEPPRPEDEIVEEFRDLDGSPSPPPSPPSPDEEVYRIETNVM